MKLNDTDARNSSGGVATTDRGAATAEYVVATMAAVGFATLLLVILKSDEVRQLLLNLLHQALAVNP
jgi:Protein of unknown function (DUF4244)